VAFQVREFFIPLQFPERGALAVPPQDKKEYPDERRHDHQGPSTEKPNERHGYCEGCDCQDHNCLISQFSEDGNKTINGVFGI